MVWSMAVKTREKRVLIYPKELGLTKGIVFCSKLKDHESWGYGGLSAGQVREKLTEDVPWRFMEDLGSHKISYCKAIGRHKQAFGVLSGREFIDRFRETGLLDPKFRSKNKECLEAAGNYFQVLGAELHAFVLLKPEIIDFAIALGPDKAAAYFYALNTTSAYTQRDFHSSGPITLPVKFAAKPLAALTSPRILSLRDELKALPLQTAREYFRLVGYSFDVDTLADKDAVAYLALIGEKNAGRILHGILQFASNVPKSIFRPDPNWIDVENNSPDTAPGEYRLEVESRVGKAFDPAPTRKVVESLKEASGRLSKRDFECYVDTVYTQERRDYYLKPETMRQLESLPQEEFDAYMGYVAGNPRLVTYPEWKNNYSDGSGLFKRLFKP
jgi:hypothetical protein